MLGFEDQEQAHSAQKARQKCSAMQILPMPDLSHTKLGDSHGDGFSWGQEIRPVSQPLQLAQLAASSANIR